MNFSHLISDNTGLVHLIFSIISLVTGSLVLALRKGTQTHKNIGYVYTTSMIIVLTTSFFMYNLFGTWGIFHWSAAVSTVTLALGMVPILTKYPKKNYLSFHYSFMYWSVIGLYGAFVSETFVRLPDVVIETGVPNTVFYSMTGFGVAITMALGAYFFFKKKPQWDQRFDSKASTNS